MAASTSGLQRRTERYHLVAGHRGAIIYSRELALELERGRDDRKRHLLRYKVNPLPRNTNAINNELFKRVYTLLFVREVTISLVDSSQFTKEKVFREGFQRILFLGITNG